MSIWFKQGGMTSFYLHISRFSLTSSFRSEIFASFAIIALVASWILVYILCLINIAWYLKEKKEVKERKIIHYLLLLFVIK